MTRYRNKHGSEGFLEFAVRMDWKASVGVAAIVIYVGAALVPAVLGDGTVLRAVAAVLAQFALLTAFVFAFLAVMRFGKRPPAAAGTMRLECEASVRSDGAKPSSASSEVEAVAAPR